MLRDARDNNLGNENLTAMLTYSSLKEIIESSRSNFRLLDLSQDRILTSYYSIRSLNILRSVRALSEGNQTPTWELNPIL